MNHLQTFHLSQCLRWAGHRRTKRIAMDASESVSEHLRTKSERSGPLRNWQSQVRSAWRRVCRRNWYVRRKHGDRFGTSLTIDGWLSHLNTTETRQRSEQRRHERSLCGLKKCNCVVKIKPTHKPSNIVTKTTSYSAITTWCSSDITASVITVERDCMSKFVWICYQSFSYEII